VSTYLLKFKITVPYSLGPITQTSGISVGTDKLLGTISIKNALKNSDRRYNGRTTFYNWNNYFIWYTSDLYVLAKLKETIFTVDANA